jgi:hypothetical protein
VTAYSVDRRDSLSVGLILDRVRHTDIRPTVLQEHADAMFPNGVTEHGNNYFLCGGQAATAVSANIEILFECVRRSH